MSVGGDKAKYTPGGQEAARWDWAVAELDMNLVRLPSRSCGIERRSTENAASLMKPAILSMEGRT